MIKNVAIKVFIQNTIFSVFSFFNKLKKHNEKKILLYTNLGFRDNIKALFDYIVEEGYNVNNLVICSTNDYKKYQVNNSLRNVYFVSNLRGIWEYFTAGYVYYCFGFWTSC